MPNFRFPFSPPSLSESKDLLARMIVVDPKQRYTMAEVLVNPWVISDCGEVPLHIPYRNFSIPPDDRFLGQLRAYECDMDRVKADLQAGILNQGSAIYHLMIEKDKFQAALQQAREREQREAAERNNARRAMLSAKGKRSQPQLAPFPFDPTVVVAQGGSPPHDQSPDASQYAHLRNRRTVSGQHAAQEMKAVGERFQGINIGEQQMLPGQRLAPVPPGPGPVLDPSLQFHPMNRYVSVDQVQNVSFSLIFALYSACHRQKTNLSPICLSVCLSLFLVDSFPGPRVPSGL